MIRPQTAESVRPKRVTDTDHGVDSDRWQWLAGNIFFKAAVFSLTQVNYLGLS